MQPGTIRSARPDRRAECRSRTLHRSRRRSGWNEINGDQTTTADFAALYTLDGTTFTVVDGTNTVGPVENRTFRIEFHEAGPSYGCVTTWPAVVSAVTGPRPAIPPQYMLLAMRGIDVKLDYFVQIHSD